ncbi:HipA domain-containing protein [Methanimicrococcus blatticola]|uniref:Serine/threonine-protein kinase HipA n=1 Tax=Methanimicrococcus blatticola TaxID=91560 RepID=A0A484F4P3_9EURY|nr:HipA domain-containing protein [Methanimicrococcus blatticola]MBZ3936036.1 HipA domain-containing protein [Methanimicrococcus blatticola]MCC2509352.1 HipA domain-containing protein [Methanimicrococcus blatticola]TDQ68235.1 serine/threonine-protein kinase HipA [Methanimicrococcus blatticola]
MKKCLFCYKELDSSNDNEDYHSACSKKIFGTVSPPILPYTREQINELAFDVIRSQTALTGVQPKLSLDIYKEKTNTRGEKKGSFSPSLKKTQRFTIVGLWGRYILKPQSEQYKNLPELEDVTMHLAELSKIKVVPHSLIRFADGELCYITKRIDRDEKGNKFYMEDMCQLTERMTEHKYKGSYEQIQKVIQQHSQKPNLDTISFCEQLIFCWLTGNADMHLKNFSLIKDGSNEYRLSPAYDMLATKLAIPEDLEETALMLSGKKRKIGKEEFEKMFDTMKVDQKYRQSIYKNFRKTIPSWFDLIDQSFLPDEMKEKYKALVKERSEKMGLM